MCRYRYATGCTAEFGTKPGLTNHEKSMHAEQRVELRHCPECGTDCGSEMARAAHLSNDHDVRAGSPRRQELDARQVAELLGTRQPDRDAGQAGPPDDAAVVVPAAGQDQAAPPDMQAAAPLDLPAARHTFAALADEAEALREQNAALQAENAALQAEAATWAKVRTMLAGQQGQNGRSDHATAS
jgi:hypothetical protein